jgi:hypothetical protein
MDTTWAWIAVGPIAASLFLLAFIVLLGIGVRGSWEAGPSRHRGAWLFVLAVVAMLAFPVAVGAYALHRPKHEHCRHGYVRRRHHHKTTCTLTKSYSPTLIHTPTGSSPSPSPSSAPPAPSAPITAGPVPLPPAPPTESTEDREARERGIDPTEKLPTCTMALEDEQVPCEEP